MKPKYIQIIAGCLFLSKISIIYATPEAPTEKATRNNEVYKANPTIENSKKNTEDGISKNTPITQSLKPSINDTPKTSKPTATNLNPDKVVLNFENADIQLVIKAISQLSGKNFVIDPRVKGTINIVSDKPISKSDSYRVLESALRMQGFASVESDGVVKVLPESDAKTYGMKTYTKPQQYQAGDQIITKIFVIAHGSAMQLSNALRPLIAPNNSITVYPNSNAIIITDYASNLARIGTIIEQLSAASSIKSSPTIVTLKNAIASDIAQILQSYLQGGGASGSTSYSSGGGSNTDGPNTTITVDANTNSLIIYSVIQDKLDELKAIAQRLDENTGKLNNNIHVVYLKNGDAAHIADVLRVVAYSQEDPEMVASSSLSKFSSEPGNMFASAGGSGGSSSQSNNGSSSKTKPTSNTRSGTNNTQKDTPKVFIQAEPNTNSLIIQAPDALYKNLRMIIDMLDVRRAQVMIEAMIVNVNSTKAGAFGVQWVVGGGNNNVGGLMLANYGGSLNGGPSSGLAEMGGSIYGAMNGGKTAPKIPNEVFIGLVTGVTTINGQQVPGLGAIADMIDSNSAGNILSRPTLITLDNEEDKIMVGQNVGIPNGQFQNSAANPGSMTTTITRQDLGTFLQIKPLITQSGAIQLEIYQEDSKVDPNSEVNAVTGPAFIRQNMRATLLVDDGQIIALGGMTQDEVQIKSNGIPILDSIPYLGWLFSWQARVHIKKNLVLFLRPVIIKNVNGYAALTNNRYKYIVDQQSLVGAKGNALLPNIAPVTLENQMPYKTTLPQNQPNNTVTNLPIVDVRESVIHKK